MKPRHAVGYHVILKNYYIKKTLYLFIFKLHIPIVIRLNNAKKK